GHPEEVVAVSPPQVFAPSITAELLRTVLPDRAQQPVPRPLVLPLGREHRFVHQSGDTGEHVPAVEPLARADLLSGIEIERARKYRQPGPHRGFHAVAQGVARGNGVPQRTLPTSDIAPTTAQQSVRPRDPLRQLLHAQRASTLPPARS